MVAGWISNYEQARQHAAWRDVPALKDPRRVPLPDHRVMTGNVFRRNLIHYTDPLFIDPAHDDYRLQPASPALKLGFQPIRSIRSAPTKTRYAPRGPLSRLRVCEKAQN